MSCKDDNCDKNCVNCGEQINSDAVYKKAWDNLSSNLLWRFDNYITNEIKKIMKKSLDDAIKS